MSMVLFPYTFLKNIFIYLVASGLSFGMQDFFFFFELSMQILSCGIWNLVPLPGIKPGPPALGVQSLSH